MALFSPSIMARIGESEFTYTRVYSTEEHSGNFFHFRGTLSELFQLQRDALTDNSPAARQPHNIPDDDTSDWCGFSHKQGFRDFLATTRSIQAQEAFHAALAKLDVAGKASTPEYRVSGGVWSVPRYLSGHPQSAIYRPKTAKPAKTFDLAASFMAMTSAEDIAKPLARIARAAWDYQKAGGSVSLVCHFGSLFSRPCEGKIGFVASVRVPLSDIASIATALSVQTHRAIFLRLASGLSGLRRDSLPLAYIKRPGILPITGTYADDATLKAASIK